MKQTLAHKEFRFRARMLIDRLIGPKTTYAVVDPGPESRFVVLTVFRRSGRVKITYQVHKLPKPLPISDILETP